MTSKLDREMMAGAAARRKPEAIDADVATTVFGRMGQELAAPQLLALPLIRPSRYQRRGRLDEAYMENLVDSIREEGLHDPVIVRPLAAPADGAGCNTITPYELVAGHHRLAAFARLGRTEIPAFVRHLSDIDAARALTTENTTRKDLGDWELYKHMAMLRSAGAVKNNTDLARVLNVSRVVVQYLDAFAVLPQAAHDLLDDHPALVGYNLAQKLKAYCPEHGNTVFDALCLLAKGRLSQAGVAAWIEAQLHPKTKAYRKDVALEGGVRLVLTQDGARLSGRLDYERLQRLIESHLGELLAPGGA